MFNQYYEQNTSRDSRKVKKDIGYSGQSIEMDDSKKDSYIQRQSQFPESKQDIVDQAQPSAVLELVNNAYIANSSNTSQVACAQEEALLDRPYDVNVELSESLEPLENMTSEKIDDIITNEKYDTIFNLLEDKNSNIIELLYKYGVENNLKLQDKHWRNLWKNISDYPVISKNKQLQKQIYFYLSDLEKGEYRKKLENFIIEDLGFVFLGTILGLGNPNIAYEIKEDIKSMVRYFTSIEIRRELHKI